MEDNQMKSAVVKTLTKKKYKHLSSAVIRKINALVRSGELTVIDLNRAAKKTAEEKKDTEGGQEVDEAETMDTDEEIEGIEEEETDTEEIEDTEGDTGSGEETNGSEEGDRDNREEIRAIEEQVELVSGSEFTCRDCNATFNEYVCYHLHGMFTGHTRG